MKKIDKLREIMKLNNIDYYIIPSADPHQSEYVAEYYMGRAYVSGFTGSAGTLLVGQAIAKLWTDGRYFIQADNQLKGTGIELMKMAIEGYDTLSEFIEKNVKENEVLAFDGRCISAKEYKEFMDIANKNNFSINVQKDLLEEIWCDRPRLCIDKARIHDKEYCGQTASEKLSEVRKVMQELEVNNYIISTLDDIAWLYNIRGNDVEFNPVVLSYAVINQNEAYLFIDERKIDEKVRENLNENGIVILDYSQIEGFVGDLQGSTFIDITKINAKLYNSIKGVIKEGTNITTKLKAIKNSIEIKNIKNCHVKDGVAMVRLIKYLKENIDKENISELSITKKLSNLRRIGELSQGDSFNTIAGFKDHAAMMHYSATEDSNYKIEGNGLFLLDSGGQYLDGTTDITRTFAIGEISEEEKKAFTLVLKGVINLSTAKFLKGTTGCNLDILARGPLWKEGIDYKCGTGHGVGFFLNVHEGPQGIRQKGNDVPLEPGMILTNEPGVYKAGEFGIRLENIMVVVEDMVTDNGQFYSFDTVTYCPIDIAGIDVNLLNTEERLWLNYYHKEVYDKLSPYLNEEEKLFLKNETREI